MLSYNSSLQIQNFWILYATCAKFMSVVYSLNAMILGNRTMMQLKRRFIGENNVISRIDIANSSLACWITRSLYQQINIIQQIFRHVAFAQVLIIAHSRWCVESGTHKIKADGSWKHTKGTNILVRLLIHHPIYNK